MNHHNSLKTHCPKNHEYNKSNTRIYRGFRYCRACANIRSKLKWSRMTELKSENYKICCICNKQFAPDNPRSRYCSKTCKEKGKWIRDKRNSQRVNIHWDK